MDIEQAVQAALAQAAPNRVYAAAAVKGAAPPFLFHLLHRDEALEELGGDGSLRTATFEVNAVGRSMAEAAALGRRAVTALQGLRDSRPEGLYIQWTRVTQESPDIREREVNLWRRVYALRINYQEV